MVRQEKTGNRLTDVHIEDFARVSHLYDGQNPTDPQTFSRRASEIAPLFSKEHRNSLANALISYLQSVGASPEMLGQAERLRDERAVAVVTGQQAGLFTGPLYAVAKALSAIGLAKKFEEELRRPVIPVFWIASEDHDFAEVNHVYMLDARDDVRRVVLTDRSDPHQMVYHRPLSEQAVDECMNEVYRLLPDGPYKLEMLEILKSAWKPGDTLSTWFARLMNLLFHKHGLVLLDPCLPALRKLIAPVWVRAISQHREVQSELECAYQEVIDAGFSPEVVRDETNTTLFFVTKGKRYVLESTDGTTLRVRGLGIEKSLAEWIDIATQDATSFSSNVLLRPVVQDYLLPTLAYVGGPSELSYHALSRAVFHVHERTLPPLIMRQRLMIYPPSVIRNMEAWQFGLEDVNQQRDLVTPFLQSKGADDIEQELERLCEDVNQRWSSWSSRHHDLGPQLKEMVDSEMKRTTARVERLKNKVVQLLEQTLADDVHQLRHIERWLWTDGHLQERRLCPINIWSKYGLEPLQQLPVWGDYRIPAPVYHVQL